MPLETIYLARHGFRLSWETQTWNAPTNTPRDPPLSAHGVEQARELAAWFASLPPLQRPQAIYSSPLYRCLQTASPTAEALGNLPIHVEFGVAEWYLPVRKDSNGLHPRSLPAIRLRQWFPLIDPHTHEPVLYPSQKGETIDEIHSRAETTLRLLLAKLDAQPGISNVVIFTHAATNIAMGRALIDDRKQHIKSATCSVGKYVRVRGKEAERDGLGLWTMEMNGETFFLNKGEERHWEFSYVEEYEEDGVLENGTDGKLASDNYKTSSVPTTTVAGKL